MEYSIAELIDQLNIVNIKIYMLVEKIQNSKQNENISDDARKVQEINKLRSILKKEIDLYFTKTSREFKI